MVKTFPLTIQDAETRRILQDLWDFLLANLAPGEKLSKEEFLDYAKVHNELNSLAQLMADACMDRFREWMHRTLRIITPEYLHERLIDEIKVFLQSNFLQPEQYNLLKSDIENAKVEMAEMNIEYDELTLSRYTLLRNLVVKEKGSFQLEKHKGICYVYNKREDLTQKAMKDFVRFAYMLKLINDKLAELEKTQGEVVVSEKQEEVQPEPSPTDVFLAKVKQIMLLAEAGNGQQKELTARGNGGSYIYKVDGKQFCQVLDELQANHLPLISSYLSGAKGEAAGGIKYVAPFIGFVLDTHLFSSPLMPKNALREVFELVYGKGTSAVYKMSDNSLSEEAESFYKTTLDIMKNTRFR